MINLVNDTFKMEVDIHYVGPLLGRETLEKWFSNETMALWLS